MQKIATFIICALLIVGCTTKSDSDKKTIFVTITPMQSIIEEITAGDFDIEVIVPKGASPETFEPTPKQVASFSDAEFIFSTGLIDFEQSLVQRISGDAAEVVNLSNGIELIAGSCSHGNHQHKHGVDPHIWTSPRALRTMVTNAHKAIMAHYPDSVKYTEATGRLLERINKLDNYCATRIKAEGVEAMMIYHPAYTYYARDYGIEQIAIEHDGKEPSLRQTTALIEKAKEHGVKAILRQPQYSEDKVRAIANDAGAEIITTDPLAEDILGEIERVTEIICR
ncbi:MAG: zinc ABC transporter substrate-binding protein [Alistipes sp.]|nr:zinc ABC transporter substrate-binding protein [Alistipes sp.]